MMEKLMLLKKVLSDIEIKSAIKESAYDTPSNPWDESDIADVIYEQLQITVDPSDKAQFSELLAYFNAAQTQYVIDLLKSDLVFIQRMRDHVIEQLAVEGAFRVWGMSDLIRAANTHLCADFDESSPIMVALLPWCILSQIDLAVQLS